MVLIEKAPSRSFGEMLEHEQSLVEAGHTLPGWFYSDPVIYAAERRAVFGTAWQFACHQDEVARPGSYVLARLGEFEVIISRDHSGQLHALRNVCAHRGSRVVTGSGQRQTLQCPYHGWTYNLDGRLRAAPGCEDDALIRIGETRLAEARIDNWGPLLFVSLACAGPALADIVAPHGALPIEWSALRFFESRSYRYRSNWKVAIDNSVECYHCPTGHPGFADLVDMSKYVFEVNGYCQVGGSSRRESADIDAVYNTASKGDGTDARSYIVWPNFMVNTSPGPPNLTVLRWLPEGISTTVCVRDFYFSQEFEPDEIDDYIRYAEEIQQQDIVLCENLQANIDTGAYNRGVFRLSGNPNHAEFGTRQFQLLVLKALEDSLEAVGQVESDVY